MKPPLTPLNNSLLLDVEMPLNASIKAKVNGREFEHTLAELLEGQRSHLVRGYLDVAVSFHRASTGIPHQHPSIRWEPARKSCPA